MTKQPSTRPRQVKSPRQRAEEALGVAERHTARLTATRDKLQGELEAVEKDLRAAVQIDWARQAISWEVLPTTRCYACGCLLTVDTVTCDRILPGAEGGTYGTPLRDTRDRRTNVRPACAHHNSTTGGRLGAARREAKRETSS